jgi:hypothetical protein
MSSKLAAMFQRISDERDARIQAQIAEMQRDREVSCDTSSREEERSDDADASVTGCQLIHACTELDVVCAVESSEIRCCAHLSAARSSIHSICERAIVELTGGKGLQLSAVDSDAAAAGEKETQLRQKQTRAPTTRREKSNVRTQENREEATASTAGLSALALDSNAYNRVFPSFFARSFSGRRASLRPLSPDCASRDTLSVAELVTSSQQCSVIR